MELSNIIQTYEESSKDGHSIFLATLVKTQGSTYRQPGAKMLITAQGKMVGSLSPGCLEKDIFEYTRQRMSDNKPVLLKYDTTAPEDIVWGFGLGCEGVIEILLEPLAPNNSLCPVQFFSQCLFNKQIGVMAAVIGVTGAVKVEVGERLIFQNEHTTTSNIKEEKLVQAIAFDSPTVKSSQKSALYQYHLTSGLIEVFIETIKPPTPLIIFGAGSDVLPVVKFAKTLGWHVTIVDCRALPQTYQRFTLADEVILTRRDILSKQVSIAQGTISLIMTHNYLDDLEIIKFLIPSSCLYVGLVGSKQRTEKILLDSQLPNHNLFHKLYNPVGLDIGAETPIEIALAIVAEIQAFLTNRQGGILKYSSQPLHKKNEIKSRKI